MGPYGPMDKWHHVTCYPLAGIADVATISGFNLLTSAQQVRDSPMLCFPCCSQKSTHTNPSAYAVGIASNRAHYTVFSPRPW